MDVPDLRPSGARPTSWIPAGLVALSVAFALASTFLSVDPGTATVPWAVVGLGFLGLLVVRRTANPIGWLLLSASVAATLSFATDSYALASVDRPGLPGLAVAGWLNSVTFAAIAIVPSILFLLFPSGRPTSRRWHAAVWAWGAGGALLVSGAALQPEVLDHPSLPEPVLNPLPWELHPRLLSAIVDIGLLLSLGAAVLSVLALFLRFRRARAEERAQIKWLVFVAASAIAIFLFMAIVETVTDDQPRGVLRATMAVAWVSFVLLLTVGIPVAMAIAILKYRLYDIDVVIKKTVVYGALAAFITAVYVGIVVGIGSLVARGDEPNVALQIAATAVVAVAFQPVRERLHRFANRLVYGRRATPYEVLARFSERVAGTYATEDVLPRTARVIAEGTGASRVDVWLRVGDELRAAATWPKDAEPRDPAELDDLLTVDAGRTVEVRLGDELLGAVTVDKPASEPFTPAEDGLLNDVAGQAGLVLSNVRLTAELEANLQRISRQAAELRASRQRIVAAQDAERRRLERNIHDGAQQHLVALAVKLRLARQVVAKDAVKGRAMLLELQQQLDETLDTLTSLALGIYPPLLQEQGIAAALAAQYTRSGLPVHMVVDGAKRYPIETEAAVYFCVLEALQNAAKHAHASRIDVRLEERQGELWFEVADDGAGFDPVVNGGGTGLQGMRDRLSILGGDAEIESAPGRGTTVRGRVPISRLEAAG